MGQPDSHRRTLVAAAAAWPLVVCAPASAQSGHPDARWFDVAEAMRRRAESWGDQSYGAAVVLDGEVVGYGPSRVVKDADPDAHAERVAIRDAQRRLGRPSLAGAVLYSTSRPCARCAAAAGHAQVARMYFGATLQDAGTPRPPSP